MVKAGYTVLVLAVSLFTWTSCVTAVEDPFSGGEGCLAGSPAFVAGKIDYTSSSGDLSLSDDDSECWNCDGPDELRYKKLDPAGNGDWQIQAEVRTCCNEPQSEILMRIDGSGVVRWTRTTCWASGVGLIGVKLVDAIPFAGGHLATYRVPGNFEVSTEPDVELRYMNAGGQIRWTLSGEAIGNAKWVESFSRTPGQHARFIASNDSDRFFLSVSPDGKADLVPLPDDFGGAMTGIPDLPEEESVPLLLVNEEDDLRGGYTRSITFTRLNTDGTVADSKDVGTWKLKYSVSGVFAKAINPPDSGYLIQSGDNKTNISELILLDRNGDRVWSYKGLIDSVDWLNCSRDILYLLPDGRLLVLGNRYLSPTNKMPYWGTLFSDGVTLDFQIKGDLEMPFANSSAWSLGQVLQDGNRWIVIGATTEPGDPTTSGSDTLMAIYDSEFKLIHAINYGLPGHESAIFAKQGDTWGMVFTHFISELQCYGEIHPPEANTTFQTFNGICE